MHWILLRGLARESAHWGGFIDELARARPDDRFHTPDLYGTGRHHRRRAPLSIAATRARLQQDCAGIPAPFGLIGLSMGAMVAMDWAGVSDECRALVLMSPSSGLSPVHQRLRLSAWRVLLPLLMSGDRDNTEETILQLTSNRDIRPEVRSLWLAIQRQRPALRTNALRQLWAASRFRPPRCRRDLPALILASRADRLVDWRCSDLLSRSMQWPLALHASAGHDLPLDASQWVVGQISRHFPTRQDDTPGCHPW